MEKSIALKNDMLIDISELDFMLTDLNLYLDVHPEDMNALNLYNNLYAQKNIYKCKYIEQFGPLTPGSTSNTTWNWINNPWPWEKGGSL